MPAAGLKKTQWICARVRGVCGVGTLRHYRKGDVNLLYRDSAAGFDVNAVAILDQPTGGG